MSTRVTNLSMQNQALYNLQSQMGRMAKLNDQMTTGRAFNKPSEDPTATVTAMRVRADQRVNAQYERNVRDGRTWMDAADSAIQGSMDLLRKARDLTVQGSNTGSYGPASLRAIASEVRALSEGIRQQANTQVNGRSIFAGNSDAEEAFAADGTHAGSGGTVERRISGATTVRVDADGEAVYGNGASSVFATLNELATLLETPDVNGSEVAKFLGRIDGHLDNMTTEIAEVGTRYNQLITAESDLLDSRVSLEAQKNSVENIDLAEASVRLTMQEVAYQASLSATSRAVQPSLLDFLR